MKTLLESKYPLTVKDLLELLQKIPEPHNVLVGLESDNHIWELNLVTRANINYRKVLILHPSDFGISKPTDAFRDLEVVVS